MSERTIISHAFEIPVSEKLVLKGRVKATEEGTAKPVVIIAHGFRGFQDWAFWPEVTDSLAERGFYAVSFDFARIAAKESGLDDQSVAQASTITQELGDLDTIVQYVRQGLLPLREQYDSRRIAVIGHSRAGGSSLLLAGEQPDSIQAVVVWNGGASPVASLDDPNITLVQRLVAEDALANQERFDVIEKFRLLEQPVLVVQGSSDSERLLAVNQKLREAAPDQTFVSIEGADHTFGVLHPYSGATSYLSDALQATLAFLKKVY
ncbi:alpha/beta hydrolase family protein [Paenibacillus sp. 2TAB19]|uniref:alpha/beta hydrolase family protein n=1 Tax=Paenibacillus sp. 2TAB19 TaxID=3233003 RepID=UPI003F98210E